MTTTGRPGDGVVKRAVTAYGVEGIPAVRPGDDLGLVVAEALGRMGMKLVDRDVVVVTQKVVSKSEGRLVDLEQVVPSERARALGESVGKDPRLVELVLRESTRVVRAVPGILIVETRRGLICANAGIDSSNVEGETTVALLPADPDASAARIRLRLLELTGADVAVIVSDTYGRPWREGTVNFAIGVAGMNPFVDYRGLRDPYGKVLKATRVAVADEIAALAELVTGKLSQVPVVVVRGCDYAAGAGSAAELLREASLDLFR